MGVAKYRSRRELHKQNTIVWASECVHGARLHKGGVLMITRLILGRGMLRVCGYLGRSVC